MYKKLTNFTTEHVFFPICHAFHFYVIAINMKNKSIVILDNSNSVDDENISVKYGLVPMAVVCTILRFSKNCTIIP